MRRDDIEIWNYGNNTSSNTKAVRMGALTLYWSYKTIVAFAVSGRIVVCENVWSRTTGKHLNFIDSNKANRLPVGEFNELLDRVLSQVNISASKIKLLEGE